jgi:hypothetical protein
VAQEHDVDQRRQLPEENLAVEAEHDGRAVGVGNGDRHGDQRHHAGLATAQLVDDPAQERPAAIEVDDARERQLYLNVAPEAQRLAHPEGPLDHRRQRNDRNGQG